MFSHSRLWAEAEVKLKICVTLGKKVNLLEASKNVQCTVQTVLCIQKYSNTQLVSVIVAFLDFNQDQTFKILNLL